ncbi:hypothetical protein SAMN05421770_10597 [Granulicella rosea]|uniref:Uncharacterized protein n=1 Tax=Granulicella rosea TaxID=474952 RepID=A0A239KRC1_9BACT|nr:hypothetical protein [Granulicella rosea]SNT19764.1 hypothetical protein SAMN05421770_10597 [Granulicella rosea]
MKKALLTIAQLLLFLFIFFVGSLMDPFHMRWAITHPDAVTTRYFVPDGLILMLVVYAVIVGAEALTKKLRTAGLLTTIAAALALVLGLLSKFGWLTKSLY